MGARNGRVTCGDPLGRGGCWERAKSRPPGHTPAGLASRESGRSRISVRQGARRAESPVARQTLLQEIEMSTIHRFQPAVFIFATVLTFTVSAPIAVNAEDQDP